MFFSFKNIKTGSIDTSIPKNLTEWAVFLPNDELLEIFTLPQARQRGLNKNTISKPVRHTEVYSNFNLFFFFSI